METTINERIKYLYEKSGLKSVRQFSEKIGVPNTTLSECIKGSEPRFRLIDAIMSGNPDVSAEWLLTGKGSMLKEEPVAVKSYVAGRPYFNVDFLGGFDLVYNDQTSVPEYLIDFKKYDQADFWCNISGHSMEPEITHGDIIALKEVSDWQTYLPLGEIYAIVTSNDLRTVKKVRAGSDKEHLKLVPVNTKDYDEQEIAVSAISRVFKVLGCMKKM